MAYKVSIDAGHGMNTSGKRTPALKKDVVVSGKVLKKKGQIIHEFEFNIRVAKALRSALQRCGIQAKIVNDESGSSDTPLSTRANTANSYGSDLHISCHYNAVGSCTSFQGSAKGLLVLKTSGCSAADSRLAENVHSSLKGAYSHTYGVGVDTKWSGFTLAILRRTKMPSILIEYGFMDYEDEAMKMLNPSWYGELAERTCKGICNYLGASYKQPSGSNPYNFEDDNGNNNGGNKDKGKPVLNKDKLKVILDTVGYKYESPANTQIEVPREDNGVKANGLTERTCCVAVADLIYGRLKTAGFNCIKMYEEKAASVASETFVNKLIKDKGWKKEECIYLRLHASFSSSPSTSGFSYAYKKSNPNGAESAKLAENITTRYNDLAKDFRDKGGTCKANGGTSNSGNTSLHKDFKAALVFNLFNIRNKAATEMYKKDTQGDHIKAPNDIIEKFLKNSTTAIPEPMRFVTRASECISLGLALYTGVDFESNQSDMSDVTNSLISGVGSSGLYTGTKYGEDYDFSSVDFSALLSATYEERKYGPGIAQITQPLIKFTNTEGFYNMEGEKNAQATEILKQYAKYYLEMNNSRIKVASVTMMCAPWLRPGFNVWLDPIYTDKIYYIDSITHSGNPQTGAFTQLSLVHGRDRKDFVKGEGFGGLNQSNNVFTGNSFIKAAKDFGPTLSKAAEYDAVVENLKSIAESYGDKIIRAADSSYRTYYQQSIDEDKNKKINNPTILKKIEGAKETFSKDEWENITGKDYDTGKQKDLKEEYSDDELADLYTEKSVKLPNLKKGKKGADVKTLQKVLNTLNAGGKFSGEKLKVNGTFDSKVEDAVKAYQKESKLKQDGTINSKTLTQINKDLKEINGNMGDYKRTKTGTGRLSQSLFTGSYTVSEIEKKLSDIYKKAPEVVQTRKALIKKGVDAVRALKDETYANNNWRK